MIGGTTISAGLADTQAQLNQAIGASTGFSTDTIAQFAAAYRGAAGGPTLALLGYNPFEIVATGAFRQLYWSFVVVSLGIMALIALQHVLNNRYSVRGRHPLNSLAQIYYRLVTGVLLIANLPLVYGVLMTLNRTLTTAVAAMGTQATSQMLQASGIGPLTLAQARADGIRQAAARRVIALYPDSASRAEMVQIGLWYNAAATAVNQVAAASQTGTTLPMLDATSWSNTAVPDDQVTATIGRGVVQNFSALISELGLLSASAGPLALDFPEGSGGTLPLLSAALASDDATAVQALTLSATPSSSAQFETARAAYGAKVQADTLTYLDTNVLPTLGASPSLAARVRDWFSQKVEHAAAAATGGLLSIGRGAIDWTARSIGVVLTRMVAYLFTAGTSALIEIDLFVLVLAMPLWLLPATEEAFHGTLRALGALAIAAPAYQFLMLFVDALMGLVLRYLVLGPLANGNPTGAAVGGGAVYGMTAAITWVGTSGEIIPIALFCYLVAYLFLAIYVAFKTPRIVTAFLKGAGAAGAFLSTFATGLIAGATAAFATASVASGGSLSARWIQFAGGGGVSRFAGARPLSSAAGPFVSRRFAQTARFGLSTFVEGLGAKSPLDGAMSAFDALADYRKQQEKIADALNKAEAKADKAAAPKRTPRPKAK